MLVDYVRNRLHEASTWRGLIYVITSLGVTLTDAQATAVIAAGMALAGMISVFFPDKKGE
jgi:hypothetical protein